MCAGVTKQRLAASRSRAPPAAVVHGVKGCAVPLQPEEAGRHRDRLRVSPPDTTAMTTARDITRCSAPFLSSFARSTTVRGVTRFGAFGVLAAFVAACAPAPMPIPRSSTDPSSPNAPEGVTPAATATPLAAPAPRERHEGHHHHHRHGHGAPAAQQGSGEAHAGAQEGGASVVHVCPMHPEVTSNGPGICPKCNMKLVPKK
jgi:hypothetical protein